MRKIDLSILSWIGVLGVVLRKYNPWFLLLCTFFLFAFIPKGKNELNKEYREFYKTDFLLNFNPLVFIQLLTQMIGEIWLRVKRRNKEITENEYMLPFSGSWFVANGGITKENSHSWELITQRYAYDFILQIEEKSYFNDKYRIENYYCYGAPILAAYSGIVVGINDRTKDYTEVGNFSIDWKTNNLAGNYIVIKHPNKEFSFYAHLKEKSIKVAKGDKVSKGQIIALCGNSGRSTEPHLHFQVMNCKKFLFGKSLKIQFKSVIENKGKKVVYIKSDTVVKNENSHEKERSITK